MSHLGDVVWLSQDPLCDPMGEFGTEHEDDQATRPLASSLFKQVAAVSRIAIPLAPPPEEPAPVRLFPDGQLGTGCPPRFHHLCIGPGLVSDPVEEVHHERIDCVRHGVFLMRGLAQSIAG